jgi:hypothetical protein
MGRNLRSWWGLGVAMALALQSAQAGGRKAAGGREQRATTQHMSFPARAGAAADNHVRVGKFASSGEVAFFPVKPLEVKLVRANYKASGSDDGQSAQRPASRPERKSVTFFRLNPKFGDVSVQPVFGGVNGAQISVGF